MPHQTLAAWTADTHNFRFNCIEGSGISILSCKEPRPHHSLLNHPYLPYLHEMFHPLV
ncbi:hypothetical protein DD564_15325 [Vibrio cholerae O1 biovar El Tor]|nr:hypothetical protein DD564_15325 [Vibrio cholerae O1 biovar El Tor]